MPDNSSPGSQSSQVNDLINVQIPSWNSLFGQDSQCECNECESITGAPHYLASILYFLETCVRNENLVNADPVDTTKKIGETPYDILIKRVPYLPYLPLTCENTNIQLPYIQVVLEILEFYAASKTLVNMPAYDSGSDDWEANYLATATSAYGILSTACYPFTLPYNQPLDVTRTYLSKLKTSYSELLEIFGTQDNNNNELQLVKEYLGMSDEEYSLLTQFKIGDQAFEAFNLYGFDTSADFQNAIYAVPEFLQRTGLQYAELISILDTRFINPGVNAVNFIENLFINGSSDVKPIFAQLKDIRNAPLDNSFDTGLGVTIKNLLQQSENPGLDAKAFKNWIDINFDDLQNTVVIIPTPGDPCNYDDALLRTILSDNDSSVTPPVTDDTFKRLYFFIRLLRKTGLQITELDDLLYALPGSTNDEMLTTIFVTKKLMQKFGLSAGQVASIYGEIDSTGTSSTYGQLFLNSALNKINTDYLADPFGNFFTSAVPLKTGDQYNTVLLSALQILPGQMDSLVMYFGIDDPTKFTLSMESVSVFYSYALLSQSLNLQLNDLLGIIAAFNKPAVLRVWDKINSKFNDANLLDTLSLIEFTDVANASGFSLNELLFIAAKGNDAVSAPQITGDAIKQMLIALQQGIANIDQQNPDIGKDAAIDENLVKNKLLQIYNKDVVMQLTGMLSGNIVYGITLPFIPPSNIPDSLATRISYSTNNGTCRLEVTGVLTANDWDALKANPGIKNGLQPVFDKPADFLKDNFSQFISTDDGNKLLDRAGNQTTSLADKLNLFYSLYQPFLVKQFKYKLIIQQIAPIILLDEKLTQLIIQPVIDDLYQSAIAIVAEISTTSGYFPQSEMDDFENKIISLYKPSLFISKFGLNVAEVAYFMNAPADFSNIDFKIVSLEQWQKINNYVILRKLNRSAQFSFIDLFKQAAAPGSTIQSVISSIVLLTGWQQEDIAGIVSTYSYGVNDFRNEEVLFIMSKMMQVVNKTGIKATQLSIWAKQDTAFNSLISLASAIKNTLLLQYDASERNDKETTINGNIFQNQRDALVAYILTLDEIKNAGIKEVEALCGWFLIDVPMNACMPTTRIRQAISSVQSFVKRCLIGLETVKDSNGLEVGVQPKYIYDDIWEPMSLFRTWQVKMEFLIYPYPYLSYKYIIDKSEAVKTFEETLLKSDITAQNVDDAYRTYLQDLSKTANLEVACMYIDDADTDNKSSTKLIHLVGKSRSASPDYYYCTKDEEDKWSFWEKITVAIKENDSDDNSPSGAHVIFAKFKKRYYLFLPEFIKRQASNTANDQAVLNQLETKKVSDVKALEYWEVKMAVSEYYNGKWGPKKYLQPNGDPGLFQNIVTEKNVSTYFFTLDPDTTNNLTFSLRSLINQVVVEKMRFTFLSTNSAISISYGDGVARPQSTGVSYQNIKLPGQMTFPVAAGSNETPPVILAAFGEKLINFSPQFSADLGSIYSQPFFFHDKDRSYYVTSKPITYTVEKTVTEYKAVTPTLQPSAAVIQMLSAPEASYFLAFHLPNN